MPADVNTANGDGDIGEQHQQGCDQAELFPDHGKNEIGVVLWDKAQLLAAIAQAGIQQPLQGVELAKVPILLVVGKREAEEKTVSLRRLGGKEQEVLPLAKAVAMLADEALPPDLRRPRLAQVA